MTDSRPRFTTDDSSADDGESQVTMLVRAAAPHSFGPGFRDRVLAGIAEHRDTTLVTALERQFIRIVPLAAAAALLLAGYNWWGGRNNSATTLDAALNLPQVTLATAYSPAQLFGTTIAPTENP